MKVYIGRYPGKRSKDPNAGRKIRVRIDDHDIWGLDNTLSHIIHPALVKLREHKHGAPYVDDEDVPPELRSDAPGIPPKKYDWDTDENHFKRWDWVLDEMIWAFDQERGDGAWEDQYYTGESDIQFVPVEDNDHLMKMIDGPKSTWKWDRPGWEAHAARMKNGFRLFGKYYQALWD